LHLIPSGILNEHALNLIGNGVVFDPEGFLKEIDGLEKDGISTGLIKVSDRSHIIFPYHKEIDRLSEDALGDSKIGTTKKGIGPCYMDKVERIGLRVGDMLDWTRFEAQLRLNIRRKNEIITKLYQGTALAEDAIVSDYKLYSERVIPFIADTGVLVHEALKAGKKILLEGAQGTMLDVDYGTYPYVTSSHPVSGGFSVGAGLGPNQIEEVLGIAKAYTTRVGMGPFVTELDNEIGNAIRIKGNEFGTTTGRARRCGWLDTVVLCYSARINGMTCVALMLLDVLGGFEEIKICTGYRYQGEIITDYPASLAILESCEPVYETFEGWKEDLSVVTAYDALPDNAKRYIERIEALVGIPVKIVSVGPRRDQTIIRDAIFRA
ncbi:MAG: adenylosuccinate synthase, partial [Erysipelotrichaceae bacterium]|nr:adenylosuccinate synthase [Erysipelotrichaceae bacterium]